MKRLRVIIFSFISILIIGIVLTYTLINSNIETGVHKIELENRDTLKNVEISIDKFNDTLDVNNKSSISELEMDYIKSIFVFLEENIDLKNGLYKLKF